MKKEQQQIIADNYQAILNQVQESISMLGINDFKIFKIDIELEEDIDETLKMKGSDYSLNQFTCPVGYKKKIIVNPITGEEKIVCVKV